MRKSLVSLLVLVCILFGSISGSFAVNAFDTTEANALNRLGLLKGGDAGFELERAASRVESAVLLIRLLGLEQDAKAKPLPHPFTDVPAWATSYIGKLYQQKLTAGVTPTQYGSMEPVSAKEFAVFLLRALGYVDGSDFTWQTVFERALEIGIFTNLDAARYQSGDQLLRGDIVHLMSRVLLIKKKSSENTLLSTLVIQNRLTPTVAAEWFALGLLEGIDTKSLNDYEKSLVCHDLVIQGARYGYLPVQIDPNQTLSRTAYGVLALGGGVCGGYAEAYKLLASKIGLDVKLVSGRANGTDGWNAHAWNLVRIDGQWYHIDVTFDDPVGSDIVRYNYFHVTDREIAVDHTWTAIDYPGCTATAANYYVHNSKVVASVSEFKSSILLGVNQRVTVLELKVLAYDDSLYGQEAILNIMKLSGVVTGYSRTIDDKMGIVKISNIRYVN